MCFRIWELLVDSQSLSLSQSWGWQPQHSGRTVTALSTFCSGRGNLCWPLITQIVYNQSVLILTIYWITHHYSIAELQVSEIHNSIALTLTEDGSSKFCYHPLALPDVRSKLGETWDEARDKNLHPDLCFLSLLWFWGLAYVLYSHSARVITNFPPRLVLPTDYY